MPRISSPRTKEMLILIICLNMLYFSLLKIVFSKREINTKLGGGAAMSAIRQEKVQRFVPNN